MTYLDKKNIPWLNLGMSLLGPAALEAVLVQATENTFFFFFLFPDSGNSCQINLPVALIQFFI